MSSLLKTPEDWGGGISFSVLLNDVPHRVCSPSLSPHPPVVVLVRLWEGGRVVRCQGVGGWSLVDAATDFYLERRAGHHVHPPIITITLE
eukprot:scaffold6126_cov131-Isochrysis_galbana.AAC.1